MFFWVGNFNRVACDSMNCTSSINSYSNIVTPSSRLNSLLAVVKTLLPPCRYLDGNDLNGTIPASWASLPSVEHIYVKPGNPRLCGPIPAGLERKLCDASQPDCLQRARLDGPLCPPLPLDAAAGGASAAESGGGEGSVHVHGQCGVGWGLGVAGWGWGGMCVHRPSKEPLLAVMAWGLVT